MKVLLDEMYPAALAAALVEAGIDTVPVSELRLTGAPDSEVFAAARQTGRAVLTENVTDFARLAAEHLNAGGHHAGVLIALSSRFSRRRPGIARLTAAVAAVAGAELNDRVVYLRQV